MNYGKYDTICCKRFFYLLICNELSCIDPGYQLLIITNTMKRIKILQPSNFNVYLHGYVSQCIVILHFTERCVDFDEKCVNLELYELNMCVIFDTQRFISNKQYKVYFFDSSFFQ